MGRNTSCFKQKLRKGLWSPEEDEKLLQHITNHGHGCWSSVPKLAGLQRCGKSCRLRWINYLRPDLKRGAFSQQEEDLIIQLHAELGNRWSQIAARLPGRTDNEIKNLWNSSIKKRLREKGIDPNTHKPLSPTSRTPTSSHDDDDDGAPPKPGRPMWRNTSPRFSADYDTGLPLPFQHAGGSKLFDAGDSGSISSVLPPTFTSILPTSPSLGVMASHLQENMESARACCGNALVGSGYWESGTSSSGSGSGSGSGATGTGGGGGSTSSSLEPQASAAAAAAASFLPTTELPWPRELIGNLNIDDDELDELKWSEFLQSATMGVPSIPPPPTFHHQSNYMTPEAKTAAAQLAFEELSSWQQLGRPTLLPPSPLRQENQSQNQMMQSSDKDFQRISSASFGHV